MASHEKIGIRKLFIIQVILSFVVIAVLIVLGGILVFKFMSEDYTRFTVLGFVATAFFAFIVFQPNGTLFAARAELIREKAGVKNNEKTSARSPIANPLLKTAPLGLAAAVVLTAVFAAIVYGLEWIPSPAVTVAVSLLFLVPFAFIVKRFIYDDLSGLAAAGPFSEKPVASKDEIHLDELYPAHVCHAAHHQYAAGKQGVFSGGGQGCGVPGADRGDGAGLRGYIHVHL